MQEGCQATIIAHPSQDWLDLIEHPVYDDSGHRNIKPDREGPAGDAPVPVEAFFKSSKKRDQSQRNHRDRQNGVSEKDGEIDEPYTALPLERNGADLVMVNEIGNQKKNRTCEGSEHARLVRLDVSRPNKKVSGNQQNGTE